MVTRNPTASRVSFPNPGIQARLTSTLDSIPICIVVSIPSSSQRRSPTSARMIGKRMSMAASSGGSAKPLNSAFWAGGITSSAFRAGAVARGTPIPFASSRQNPTSASLASKLTLFYKTGFFCFYFLSRGSKRPIWGDFGRPCAGLGSKFNDRSQWIFRFSLTYLLGM